jgi:hypothetical protein
MALEAIALEAVIKGLVGLGVKVFGEMGEIKTYRDRHTQLQILAK